MGGEAEAARLNEVGINEVFNENSSQVVIVCVRQSCLPTAHPALQHLECSSSLESNNKNVNLLGMAS